MLCALCSVVFGMWSLVCSLWTVVCDQFVELNVGRCDRFDETKSESFELNDGG